MELDSRLVEICRDSLVLFVKTLQSWNRNNILVLRKPDIRIGVIIGQSEPVLWNLQGTRSNLETFGGKSIEN